MLDVSESGAKLMVRGSIEGLKLKEFFVIVIHRSGLSAPSVVMGQRGSDRREIRNAVEEKGGSSRIATVGGMPANALPLARMSFRARSKGRAR
jgi:hypothetical protein